MQEPLKATLMVAATGLHELYLSYLKAGFSRSEAFELVKVVLAEQVKVPKKET
jgi:hypothetical protein